MPVFSIPLSGLNASSAALATIANNLANLNTVGYKQSRTEFRDLFYQTIGSNGAGNTIQTGAGTAVDGVASNFTPGSVETTGVPTDVAIGGDGFFVVEKDGVQSFTRAGDFTVSKNGTLTTNDGADVLGFPAVNGAITQLNGLAPVTVGNGFVNPANPTSVVAMTSNLDANAAIGDVHTSPVTVYDSLGQGHVLSYTFTKTAAGKWNYDITVPGEDVGVTTGPVSVKSGTLQFDGMGNLTSPSADVTGIKVSGFADGANDLTFKWQVISDGTSLVTQVASPSSTSSTTQDGYNSGSLLSFSIGSDGVIEGKFSNDKSGVLGQLVLANFPNTQGLVREGSNNFKATLPSGAASIGTPGTGGRGTLSGGALELSNVDIATEFARLITAQRAFQANARAITTFDEITQDTIALKR